PGGSVTGAPKVRTMEIIRELEPHPRNLYTGALGYLRPGGDCVFSIPIRTVLIDTRADKALFHVGGGITHGSTGEGEFEECRVKMGFLTRAAPGFRLLETIALSHGSYRLLNRHVQRMECSARYFGFAFAGDAVMEALEKIRRSSSAGAFRVRLLLSEQGGVEVQLFPMETAARTSPLRLGIARDPVSSANVFLFHKTTNRSVYEDALRQCTDCDDVILVNERGELTESTRANLVLEIAGEKLTPPLSSGLLAGTFRQELLDSCRIREAVLLPEDLGRADHIWLINSVRAWMEAKLETGV
ncbi:MAG: aminotransferase class IV, partial [Desulfovibrionales bacterium]